MILLASWRSMIHPTDTCVQLTDQLWLEICGQVFNQSNPLSRGKETVTIPVEKKNHTQLDLAPASQRLTKSACVQGIIGSGSRGFFIVSLGLYMYPPQSSTYRVAPSWLTVKYTPIWERTQPRVPLFSSAVPQKALPGFWLTVIDSSIRETYINRW